MKEPRCASAMTDASCGCATRGLSFAISSNDGQPNQEEVGRGLPVVARVVLALAVAHSGYAFSVRFEPLNSKISFISTSTTFVSKSKAQAA
eukprot:3608042-Rhodomonas_salina.4